MAERFTVTLKQIIDEFRLEVLYCPGDPADILVSENDITRPGLQLMGFYEYFNPERLQIIGKKYRDEDVFAAAYTYEQIAPWNYDIPHNRI